MGRSLREVASQVISYWPIKGKLLPILFLCLIASCSSQGPEEEIVEVRFSEIGVEAKAVLEIFPLVFSTHIPNEEQLSPAHRSLFTYLAKTDPADLVTTKPHSQGRWRIEKIFLLDDTVAVQLTEGHYLETVFFVQYSKGWRLKARITPRDHG